MSIGIGIGIAKNTDVLFVGKSLIHGEYPQVAYEEMANIGVY